MGKTTGGGLVLACTLLAGCGGTSATSLADPPDTGPAYDARAYEEPDGAPLLANDCVYSTSTMLGPNAGPPWERWCWDGGTLVVWCLGTLDRDSGTVDCTEYLDASTFDSGVPAGE